MAIDLRKLRGEIYVGKSPRLNLHETELCNFTSDCELFPKETYSLILFGLQNETLQVLQHPFGTAYALNDDIKNISILCQGNFLGLNFRVIQGPGEVAFVFRVPARLRLCLGVGRGCVCLRHPAIHYKKKKKLEIFCLSTSRK